MKKKVLLCLASLLFLFSGSLGMCALFGEVYEVSILGLVFWGWWIAAALALCGGIFSFYFLMPEETPLPLPPRFSQFEQFMKECKRVMKGHLKISMLFWILAYRKEKVKSFEEARKEIVQEISKEVSSVFWMGAILEEIQNELARYKQ